MNSRTGDRESTTVLGDVGVVVVHHNSLGTIGNTIFRILSGGISHRNIVVVDNSGQTDEVLRKAVGPHVTLLKTPNRGYGRAVNDGISALTSGRSFEYVLVSTHETTPNSDTIHALRDSLIARPDAAVAGPVLTTDDGKTIWSAGGYFTARLNLPRHIDHKVALDSSHSASREVRDVEWVDGAFMLYRFAAIKDVPMDEKYFLYMEETDHHTRLRRLGWRILCAQSATVGQTSNGIPDYYLTRNLILFQKRNGTTFPRIVAAPAEIARRKASHLLGRGPRPDIGAALKGWLDGLRGRQARNVKSIAVVNPIAAALDHYSHELTGVSGAAGFAVTEHALVEPSNADYGRLGWLIRHYWNLLRARYGTSGPILITWPPLGLLDLPITRLLCGRRACIVVHDPVPLVRSIGYGKLTAKVVARLPRCRAITHSESAQSELLCIGITSEFLPHPAIDAQATSSFGTTTTPIITAFGQYKPDRDTKMMAEVAKEIGDKFTFKIAGRGWPAVPGWDLDSRFITEAEVIELLKTSSAVVIPYRRFFQSGVAVRCLELGRPFVGPRDTSLSELVGSGSRLLTSNSTADWASAIEYAVERGEKEILSAKRAYLSRVDAEWKEFLNA